MKEEKKAPGKPFDMESIIVLIAERFNRKPETIGDDTHLINDLGADSIDMIDVLLTLESAFGCRIPFEDSPELYSPKAIYQYLSEM